MRTSKGLALLLCVSLLLLACDLSSAIRPPATGSTATPAGPAGTPTRLAAPTAAPTLPSKPSADPTTLTYDASGDPDTLDAAFDYETTGGGILQNLYDTLVFYNKDKADRFVPQLATSVPSQANGGISADGKTYTFQIRTGVKFHNGDTLTPADVAFTFQRGLLQGGLKSPQWLLFQPILGVAASPSGHNDITDLVDPSGQLADNPAALLKADPAKLAAACQAVTSAIVADNGANTVTFHLAQPWGPFLATLANAWGSVVDKKWIGANGGWDGDCKTWQNFYQSSADNLNQLHLGQQENGTGPYTLDHWTPGQEIVLKAFAGYWRTQPAWPGGPTGAPRLKTIVISFGSSQIGEQLADLRSGAADLIGPGTPPADWPSLDPIVGETCAEVSLCTAAASASNPLRVYKNLPAASRSDIFFNYNISGTTYTGSGLLDGAGIPPNFFTDVHVRQGFSYCFDWDAYLKQAQNGEGKQSFDLMLPGEIGANDQDPHYTHDPQKCELAFQGATLRSASGQSLWNTGFKLTIPYDTGNTQRQAVAEILAADLKAVNPKFVVLAASVSSANWFAARNGGSLPLFADLWQEDIHDPHDWLVPYVTGFYAQLQSMPRDVSGPLAGFINQGVQETDPEKRAAIYQQFNQAFYAAAPDILLTVQNNRQYEQRWVQGYYYNPIYSGFYFYALWKN
jgi:peptide/nickel transport system substrate-binding protein